MAYFVNIHNYARYLRFKSEHFGNKEHCGRDRRESSLIELLAEARGIRIAMVHGAITREAAKKRAEPMLEKLNHTGQLIANKFGVKYRKITFEDLGRSLNIQRNDFHGEWNYTISPQKS